MKKKQDKVLTITEMVVLQNQTIKLLKKEILGLYILFAIFWLYVIVESLIQVSILVEN